MAIAAEDETPPMLTAALEYAARGWHVLPLTAGTKDPLFRSHGWKDGTTDADIIRAWWQENPNYNVGISTGLSGLFVIDCDPGSEAWLASLKAQDPELAQAVALAPMVRTPRGGAHYYLAGDGSSSASKLANGVDTRGRGGYVVAPPSRVFTAKSKGSYGWERDGIPIDAPAAFLEAFNVANPQEKHSTYRIPAALIDWDSDEALQRGTVWLQGLVRQGRVAVEGQGGDAFTYEVACYLLEMGITEETALDMLEAHWNPHCSPPWQRDELAVKVANAMQYGQDTDGGKARQPLDQEQAHLIEQAQGRTPEEQAEFARFDPVLLALSVRNMPPMEWLIDGLLPRHGIGFLYGPSGSLKTFIALDLAMSVATGMAGAWWRDGERPAQDVLYLVGEGARAFQTQRVNAWLAERPIPGLLDRTRMWIVPEVPPIEISTYWEHIEDRLERDKVQPVLIIVDTLAKAMVGMDENNARDMGLAMRRLEAMARRTGAFVLTVHHTGKNSEKGARGSSVLHAAADTMMEVERLEPRDSFALNLHLRKQKDGEESALPMRLAGRRVGDSLALHRDWDWKGDEVTPPPAADASAEWAQPSAIAPIIKGNPMTTPHLALSLSAIFGVPDNTIRRGLQRMAPGRFKEWYHEDGLWRIPDSYTEETTPPPGHEF